MYIKFQIFYTIAVQTRSEQHQTANEQIERSPDLS